MAEKKFLISQEERLIMIFNLITLLIHVFNLILKFLVYKIAELKNFCLLSFSL